MRKQQGELKKNAAGEVTDRESRLLMYQINSMMRPITFDEEESSTLQDSQARFLLLAIANYRRYTFTSKKLVPHMQYALKLLAQICQKPSRTWFSFDCPRLPEKQYT